MIVHTKKYKGDPLRAYKALMRKMSKEGFYKEFREKEYFKSKSQKNREEIARGIAKEQKRVKKKEQYLEQLDSRPFKKTRQKQKS